MFSRLMSVTRTGDDSTGWRSLGGTRTALGVHLIDVGRAFKPAKAGSRDRALHQRNDQNTSPSKSNIESKSVQGL